jgi:hypothetical protein
VYGEKGMGWAGGGDRWAGDGVLLMGRKLGGEKGIIIMITITRFQSED